MSDNLIGLIILIVAFNVFARVVRAVSRASKQPPDRRESGADHPPRVPGMETDRAEEQPYEATETIEDKGPFSWARGAEQTDPFPRAAVPAAQADEEFMEHARAEWPLEDSFADQQDAFHPRDDFNEGAPVWSDEIGGAEPGPDLSGADIAMAQKPGRTAAGLGGIEQRWSRLRRMMVYSMIIGPCRAAARRPGPRLYP